MIYIKCIIISMVCINVQRKHFIVVTRMNIEHFLCRQTVGEVMSRVCFRWLRTSKSFKLLLLLSPLIFLFPFSSLGSVTSSTLQTLSGCTFRHIFSVIFFFFKMIHVSVLHLLSNPPFFLGLVLKRRLTPAFSCWSFQRHCVFSFCYRRDFLGLYFFF